MAKKSKRFGKLLRTGIGNVADRQGKTRLAIRQELGQIIGVGPDLLAWYTQGHVPDESERIEIMVRYIVANSYVNYRWANSILFQARYPDREGLLQNIFRSEDGGLIDEDGFGPPNPGFNAQVLTDISAPGGAVKLKDEFYVVREADAKLNREVIQWGSTVIIRAPRQTGKTSLLCRGLAHARQHGLKIVDLDLQGMNTNDRTSIDKFLRFMANVILASLDLDQSRIEVAWRRSLRPNQKMTNLLRQEVLPSVKTPVVLAIDEADVLLGADFSEDFFGLVRSWHNRRARDEQWNKLNLVLAISTEPYLLIRDFNLSPFNVGLKITLQDFDEGQVWDLNYKHGEPLLKSDLPAFMALLNGHPYLTRQALYILITEDLTWPDVVARATLNDGPFGEHLRHHQHILLRHDNLRGAFKEVVYQGQCSNHLAFNRLLQAGLVTGTSEECSCRCDLYQIYFQDNL